MVHHVVASGCFERGAEASLAADSLQYRMSGKRTLSQRRVGHCLDAPLALPGQQRKLNGARPEAVVDLIALRRGFKRQRLLDINPLRELVQVQIADHELANEPTLAQIIEAARRLAERLHSTPVQQI